jgi:peptidyl-prolyl cis-trans isomerase A (cyclophilin A)
MRIPELVALAASLLLAGCLTQNGGGGGADDGPINLTARSSETSPSRAGESVRLSASIDGATSGLRYRWYQTYGRTVELVGADTAQVSFVAPSLPQRQVLRFRVDVEGPGGRFATATVEVIVVEDPGYGDDGGADDGGDGGGDEDDPFPRVRLVTSMGEIVVELDREAAPRSVSNFLRYVDDGFYNGTIFHRVIADFVVQGGGFLPGLEQKETRDPIPLEADNGLRNDRGTIAMARTSNPDSATSQFYFNVKDNDTLNPNSANPGYTVFGEIVEGLEVMDEISMVATGTVLSPDAGQLTDVPVDDVVLQRAERVKAGSTGGGPREPPG